MNRDNKYIYRINIDRINVYRINIDRIRILDYNLILKLFLNIMFSSFIIFYVFLCYCID